MLKMLQSDKDYKERLISTVKKEVKQVMEESVTKKFVHEESGCVTSLCGAVEACLSQGLRRRALGLFKTSSTTALLHKIAKHCPEAANISKKVEDLENTDPTRRSSSSSDSVTKPTLKKNASLPSNPLPKYLWIRLALFEKYLAKIIDFLVSNAHKYYDKDALVADPEYGTILSSLLMGPCALDYSRMKNHDHFWSDPPADELVQRHRISSGHSTPPSVRRPILNFRRSLNTSSDDVITNRSSTQQIAKDYVETLHQNSKATLLFGKNNVLVLPVNSDLSKPIPGYLSLHQMASGLAIKWTPNQLMNGFVDEVQDKSIYWDYALNVRLDDIVYVHCHQDSETGGTVILVGQDGVQRPPIHFPKGGHMLAFLSCIETGLLPHGRLDPPLWSQRSGKNYTKRRRPLPALTENEDTSKDYVFRIVDNTCNHKDILKRNQLMDTHASLPTKVRVQLGSTSTSSESSSKSFSIDQNIPDSPPSVCIQAVCDSMKRQIISRAFYGWLAYCRHLSTVRTHLSGLVHTKIINGDGASEGITIEKWAELCLDGVVSDYAEVYRLTYFGGIAQDLRHEIWPYLLGHYKFGSTSEQRKELSEETRQAYENTMSEWLAVEAIVKQRDKENQAHAIAKLSSESMSGEQVPAQAQQEELCNEVFEDDVITDDEDESLEEDKEGGKKKNKHTKQNTIKYISDEEDSGGGKEVEKENKEAESKEVNPTPADNTNVQNDEALSSENKISTYGSNVDKEDIVVVQDDVEGDTENSKDIEQQSIVNVNEELKDFIHNVIVINASVDICNLGNESPRMSNLDAVTEENNSSLDTCIETHGLASPARSCCVSPASSNGGVYSQELLETFGLNLHRIEKDVQRCDRNYWYFMEKENLDKLRNVMCTYVWEHLDIGYMQGMCDLVAPLLVIFNDESLTYACFCHLMERMVENFPNGNAMDCHFANMRSLIQILDSEMYELMHAHGDYTHFYFCYRWFLLDFKRELMYPDVNATWEVIWAAQQVASTHFVLFLALALLETYRDIILSNGMDFTDIIKFFNEMAERHNVQAVLKLARDLVLQLQILIENK
ncbi:small G protein signaling modulator 1 isoform X2 [Diabrotica virgifera virgifera]|uniref:Small G protein signaling modulator 1-like n=1 Tax=Diabrotica virgifera virgifera TaxID=50390 RepID=A0ABM5K3K0_DIAVI|nr:small G protein signaling modulator 1 isoform X2 [Diabrotica virgifera virgifera]